MLKLDWSLLARLQEHWDSSESCLGAKGFGVTLNIYFILYVLGILSACLSVHRLHALCLWSTGEVLGPREEADRDKRQMGDRKLWQPRSRSRESSLRETDFSESVQFYSKA